MRNYASGKGSPNVLVILTDDQRFDTINALGNHEIYTPNMNRLAESGVCFTNAYIMGGAHCAVCMPSRAMLLTGRNAFSLKRCGYVIPEEHKTIPQTFAQNGYHTIGIGKWHNGVASYTRSFTDGADILFAGMEDHWNVPLCDFSPNGDYPPPKPHRTQLHLGREKEIVERSYDHIYEGRHSSEIFADAAVSMIYKYQDSDAPFFLYLATMAPHDPRTMPSRYLEMYDPESISLPENFLPEHPFDKGDMKLRDEYLAPFPRTPQSIRRELASYYAMITHLDAQIGRVLDALEETGQADNTIIVFAGDNGLAIGSHGLMGKQSLYEHSIRVPLILTGPGIPRGEKRECIAFLNQVFPTLCDLASIPVPKSVQFPSLAPRLVSDAPAEDVTPLFLYTTQSRAIRSGPYKLIEYLVDGKRMTQLFDLEADPWELTNLYLDPAFAPMVHKMRALMHRRQLEQADPMAGMFGDYEAPAPVAGPVVPSPKMRAIVCRGIFDYSMEMIPTPHKDRQGMHAGVECAAITAADLMGRAGSPRLWGNGDPAAFIVPPVVPLGEFIGVAEDTCGVIASGARFISERVVPCGHCRYCRAGLHALCSSQHVVGFKSGFDGAAAEFIALPVNARLHALPEGMPCSTALLTPDVAQAMYCIQRAAPSKDDVVTINCFGPVGLALVWLLAPSFEHLIVLSTDDACLAAATRLGATTCLNPSKTTILRDRRMILIGDDFDIIRSTDGYGCNVFINTVADESAVRLGLELLCADGRYVEAAVLDGWTFADWSLICAQKSLHVMGVMRGMGDYSAALELLARDASLAHAMQNTYYDANDWQIALKTPMSAIEKRLLKI